jgi:hypothetical protein
MATIEAFRATITLTVPTALDDEDIPTAYNASLRSTPREYDIGVASIIRSEAFKVGTDTLWVRNDDVGGIRVIISRARGNDRGTWTTEFTADNTSIAEVQLDDDPTHRGFIRIQPPTSPVSEQAGFVIRSIDIATYVGRPALLVVGIPLLP